MTPEPGKKPKGGTCGKCGHKGLTFHDDGKGECPGCSRQFVWNAALAAAPPPKKKPKGGTCGECGIKGLTFHDDGKGECPSCGRQFRWDEKKPPVVPMSAPEPLPAPTPAPVPIPEPVPPPEPELEPEPPASIVEEEIPLPSGELLVTPRTRYKKNTLLCEVLISNGLEQPISNVQAHLNLPEALQLDGAPPAIPGIDPGEEDSLFFTLRPATEVEGEKIEGYIKFRKGDEELKLEFDPLVVSVTRPYLSPLPVDEAGWRKAIQGLRKIEDTSQEILIQPNDLFDIVNDMLQDMGLHMLEPKVSQSAQFVRCRSQFLGKGDESLMCAAQVEVLGGGNRSKLILKTYSSSPEMLLGFYIGLRGEVEQRTNITEFVGQEEVAEAVADEAGEVFERGFSHLLLNEKPDVAFQAFVQAVSEGVTGLVISTTFPQKIKKLYNLGDAEVFWLTDTSSDAATLNPKRLDFEITRKLISFMKAEAETAVLLDGIEYLVLENGFGKVIKFIKKVNDTAAMNNTTVVMPINPGSFDDKERSLIKREFDKLL